MIFEISFLIVGLMQIVAFFILGTTGFGATVISAPVTNGLFGTAMGVPYGTIVCIPFLYYLAIKDRKNISWKDLAKIVALCAPGIFIGQKLFYSISPQTAKISIGTMICIIAIMNIHKYIIKPLVLKEVEDTEAADTTTRKIFRYGCLILGGIVHGAFTIGGPLITVYTLEAVKDKKKFRNTMTSLWCVLNVWNAFTQYQNGAFTPRLGSALLVAMPLAAIGYFLGMRFLEKINREQFLRIVYMLLLFIGVNMFLRNISSDMLKTVLVTTSIVVVGYIFIILKKKNINKEQIKNV
ncbi:sulfite exporter TauE/SafE family protein [uncultured Ilyobacter sp.]|uniref:sulfite exporter TauE/SafE family protein n=1 Tax=uncultured Ilyobacter sp. TaxID=544433 RepID=UPI0029F51981|nr:sulfite exporter TauE/SafE family protein [uncultured Ilyobacter sp.]